jgi:bacterioferritin-associated ferredoxin
MYVCLCLGVSDRKIREVVGNGACSVAEVMACTGAGTRCGSCRSTIAELVSDEGPPSSEAAPSVRRLPLMRVHSAA